MPVSDRWLPEFSALSGMDVARMPTLISSRCVTDCSHVRQLAAMRSWQQRGRPRSGARERSVTALGIRSQGASGEARP